MSARFFSIVDEHVGRNPVARAVQMANLAKSMREFRITLYYLPDGSPQFENLMAASQALAVSLKLRELQGNTIGVSIMRGAESAIVDRSRHGFKWSAADAVAIDMGLGEAQKAVSSATSQQVQAAWLFVRQLEAEACSASAATSL